MRPHIICHMVASIDGRIDCSMVDKISGDEYYSTLNELGCTSTLEGRVTMAHYSAAPEPFITKVPTPIGTPTFRIAEKAEGYTIAVDTKGRLTWPSNYINERPLICITSEQAPKEYLEKLSQQGISWIAVGEERIDLVKAMKILSEDFGVKQLALLGGGNINGGFLKAGLIDEVSLLLAPGIDGRRGTTALFDGIDGAQRMPTQLKLKKVSTVGKDVLWLRYDVTK